MLQHPLSSEPWAAYKRAFDRWNAQVVPAGVVYYRPGVMSRLAFGNLWPIVRDAADAAAAASGLATAVDRSTGGRVLIRPLLRLPPTEFAAAMRVSLPATLDLVEVPAAGVLSYATFSIDLTAGEKAVMEAFNPTTRKQIRQVEADSEVEIAAGGVADVARYFEKYAANMTARGTEPLSRARFEHCFREFGSQLFTVIGRDRATGSEFYHTMFFSGDVAYSFLASNDRADGASRGARNLPKYVLYRCIVRAIEQRLALFDHGGVSVTDPRLRGITEFKRGFGGQYSENNSYLVYDRRRWANRVLGGVVPWAARRVFRARRDGDAA